MNFIYGLADPTTGVIRYVGRTTQNPQQRLKLHSSCAKNGYSHPLYTWMRELLVEPVLVVLESLSNAASIQLTYHSSVLNRGNGQPQGRRGVPAIAAEKRWMEYFGDSLLNIPQPCTAEYLSNIR